MTFNVYFRRPQRHTTVTVQTNCDVYGFVTLAAIRENPDLVAKGYRVVGRQLATVQEAAK